MAATPQCHAADTHGAETEVTQGAGSTTALPRPARQVGRTGAQATPTVNQSEKHGATARHLERQCLGEGRFAGAQGELGGLPLPALVLGGGRLHNYLKTTHVIGPPLSMWYRPHVIQFKNICNTLFHVES